MGGMKRKHWIVVDRLAPIILSNVEGCVVDIGIGRSTETLYEHSTQFHREHYSCDISNQVSKWARKLFPKIKFFLGSSFDFMKQFPNISIAIIFIDGNHHYSTVIEEIKFFLPKLSSGGVMFIHDTLPKDWQEVYGYMNEKPGRKYGRHIDVCCDSYLVRQELEARRDLMVFTWPYTAANYGLTMVMKKEMTGPKFRQ